MSRPKMGTSGRADKEIRRRLSRCPAAEGSVTAESAARHGCGKESPSPLRTCLGCRQVRPQTELKRLALAVGGEKGPKVLWDEERNMGGRGAWLCRGEAGCLTLALKKRAFGRAFKCNAPDLAELVSG